MINGLLSFDRSPITSAFHLPPSLPSIIVVIVGVGTLLVGYISSITAAIVSRVIACPPPTFETAGAFALA